MADAYVNFYSQIDKEGGQAFYGSANQAHRANAAVGADAANATAIALSGGTGYCEIKATSGDIFACILATGSAEAAITAARVRIDEGEKYALTNNSTGNSLYIWAV